MRQGVQQAAHHATHRTAFGRALVDQPLMRNVLADLAVEAEASTTVALWLAGLVDATDERSALLRRIGLAVSKYYVCKRGPVHAAEALECLGGNGYVEESRMPRLFRESPLASIWEGSGNVAALDALRAVTRRPQTIEVLFEELATVGEARYDRFVAGLRGTVADEFRARTVVGDLALALQACLLLRHGHPAVADAFIASRLDRRWGTAFGTLPPGVDTAAILNRAAPKV
jgi:putative acyl-CoA dehydrogenase